MNKNLIFNTKLLGGGSYWAGWTCPLLNHVGCSNVWPANFSALLTLNITPLHGSLSDNYLFLYQFILLAIKTSHVLVEIV